LCSTALRNTDDMTKIIQTVGYAGLDVKPDNTYRVRGWLGAMTGGHHPSDLTLNINAALTQKFWDMKAVESLAGQFGLKGEAIRALATNTPLKALAARRGIEGLLIAIYWNAATSHLSELPLVLPDGPWFDQATVSAVNMFYAGLNNTWRYGTTYVHDTRPDVARAMVVSAGSPIPKAVGKGSAEELLISHTRAVVGMPNIGEIRPQTPGGAASQVTGLLHTLHWWVTDNYRATTVHDLPLSSPPDAALPTVAHI
jgi:hypothetical protein